MKHLTLKKIFASLTAVCLIVAMIPLNAFSLEAGAENESASRIISGERVDVTRPGRDAENVGNAETERFEYVAPEEDVTVIVVLDEPAAASYYNSAMPLSLDGETGADSLSPGKKLSAFLTSDEAIEISEHNKARQLEIVSEINALKLDGGSDNVIATIAMPRGVELIAQFTGVINAMSVRMPYGLLDQVKKLDGVKTAYVEKTYSIPSDEDLSPLEGGMERYGYAQAGVNGLWQEGYTGQGMVVAVLDNALDITYGSWYDYATDSNVTGVRGCHEAFRDDSFKSENPMNFVSYTKKSLAKTVSGLGMLLASETLAPGSGENWYKTLKVPYAADYSHMADDGRVDDNVHSDEDHGTHVSGTIVGFSRTEDGAVKFSGIAPDAQLLFMKVFDDDGTMTSSTPLLAALNDAAYLGADVVNLSLGSDNGFAYEDTAYKMYFDMLEEFGVIASVANGNAGNSQQFNSYTEGLAYAENPDVTMTSSPAIYDNSLAAASVNSEVYGATFLVWNDGEKDHKIRYVDTGTYTGGYGTSYLFGEVNPSDTLSENNSVYDCGLGYPEDYENYDWVREDHLPPDYLPQLNGTDSGFALVQRGEIAFSDKVLNAMNCQNSSNQILQYNSETYTSFPTQGLRGIIVYNNEPGYISMDLSGLEYRNNNSYPAISISQADGEEMAAAIAEGKKVTITFVNTEEEAAEWPVSPEDADQPGQMSSFSSWGGGPGLELKPDITAPGGMIYSAVPDGNYNTEYQSGAYNDYNGDYDYMSGTSMATPHISGIAAILSQALSESNNPYYQHRSTAERASFVEHLMVSTAVPIEDGVSGGYVSPRIQGAGLVNAAAALKTPAYVEADGKKVGKLELLDDADWTGSFDFSFNIVNTTMEAHKYNAELVVMTPGITEVNGKYAYTGHDDVISVTSLGVIDVESGIASRTLVTGSVKYDPEEIREVSPNGSYIEGYIFLTPVDEDVPTLSVPFLAFAGDWTAAPIFDNMQWWEVLDSEGNYNEKILDMVFVEPTVYGLFYGMAGYFTQYDLIPTILGANPFDPEYTQVMYDGPFYQGNFTISPNTDGYLDGINYFEMYQLRDARIMLFEISDKETGEIYYRTYVSCFPRTNFDLDSDYGVYIPYPLSLQLMNMGFSYNGERVVDYDTGELETLPDGTQLVFSIGAFGEGDYEYSYDEESGIFYAEVEDIYVNDPDSWPTFNGHKMDMTGDIISYDLLVDTSSPELEGSKASITKQEDGTYLFECVFDDGKGSIASIELDPYLTYTVKDEYKEMAQAQGMELVEHSIGDPIDSQLIYDEDIHKYVYSCVIPDPAGYTQEFSDVYDVTWDDGIFYLFCGDYGANDSAYVFEINDESAAEGELNAVWEYGALEVGESAALTVIDNTGAEGPVSFTSSDETVATVDENGVITAVGAGTAVITLEKDGKTAKVVITVKEAAGDITDFRFSIEDYKTLIPGQSITVRAEDIVPIAYNGAEAPEITDCSWEIFDPAWEYYDEGGDPFMLVVNDIPGRDYYLREATVYMTQDALQIYEPGTTGTAILTVTLNGCVRSTTVSYEIPDEEDYLISGDYYQDMTKYITLGESVELSAQYYNYELHQTPADKVEIRVCTTEGYTWDDLNWTGEASTEPSEGLYILPAVGEAGSGYEGYIVAKPGYDLPKYEDIHVGHYNIEGDYYVARLNTEYYQQWTYDENTGRFTIDSLPYSGNILVITADGVENPASQGTAPPPEFVIPSEGEEGEVDSVTGPFVWSVADADGNPIENYGTVVENNDSRNSVTFIPSAPGLYLVTATNRAGTMSVTWTVIVYKPSTDGSTALVPDTEGFKGIEDVDYSIVIEEGSDPAQLILRAYDSDGNEIPLPDDLIWETSDSSVVTVDQNGVITAVGVGLATVTVKSASNQSVNAHYVIEVEEKIIPHVHRLAWKYNETSHWRVCLDGDYVGEITEHKFLGSVCSVCGYIAPYAQPEPQEPIPPTVRPSYSATVNIEFTVVDENGAPIPNVSVTLRRPASFSTAYASTNAAGKASFNGVSFGNLTVEIYGAAMDFSVTNGYYSRGKITAYPGEKVSVTLVYNSRTNQLATDDIGFEETAEETVEVEVPTEGKLDRAEVESVR